MAETPNVMPTVENLNLNTNIVNLNGHNVMGSGDAYEMLELTLPPRYIKWTGADGRVRYEDTGASGGEAIITLKPRAPSLLTMQKWLPTGIPGDFRQFNGTVTRPDGRQILLSKGLLTGPSQDWIRAGYHSFRFFFAVIHIQQPSIPPTCHAYAHTRTA